MSHQSELIETDIHAYLKQHENKELLRFITCGSVDDGKSTLIGRLLYDSKMVYEDQLAAVKDASVKHGTTGTDFDPALLTDGLRRAAKVDAGTAARITLLPHQEAMAALRADTPPAPEVVLIDPMFPGERKTAERKAMAVLRWIAGDDPDADHLLSPALQTATRRVVVKRPRAAGPLNGQPPTVAHGGRGLRFDVYAGADLQPPATP